MTVYCMNCMEIINTLCDENPELRVLNLAARKLTTKFRAKLPEQSRGKTKLHM